MKSRIHKNIEIIFNLLSENNIKAHFFIVGWIAEKYPSIVRKIAKNGYKIGSTLISTSYFINNHL